MLTVRALRDSYRLRLVLAFALMVAIALALVLATLPRLLDGYFLRQEREALDDRAALLAALVLEQLVQYQTLGAEAPPPIVLPTDPPRASDMVFRALGTSALGYVATLAPVVAQADVVITIAVGSDPGDPVVYRLDVPLGAPGDAGQQREEMSSVESFELTDPYWTGSPARLVTVSLANPYSFRAQTLETIVGVMLAAAFLALVVAVVASIILAERLTGPIRRLTQASRALAEGDLAARVAVTESGSAEITELASAFNVMADRLSESIGFISSDRDRSRDFLADVSHELRTPIAALRTFNELLRDGATYDPEARDEFLEQSQQQIERLDWLAANLLELSKLDSGLVSLDLRPQDLRAVIEDAVEQAAPVAARKGVTLRTDLTADGLRLLHDPPRLGQVLTNLLGNAVKFTPAGGSVAVSLAETADGAAIVVTDTGVGIDPAELPHIFERFYRGAQAARERAAGSGLGLSIVRSIVEMHRGRIAVESAPGKGTSVTVSLPRAGAIDGRAARPVAVSSPSESPP